MKTTKTPNAKRALISATGCEPVTIRVTTWQNNEKEAYTGHAAELKISRPGATGLVALGYAQPDNALEALAVQLETMAAAIRKMKEGK